MIDTSDPYSHMLTTAVLYFLPDSNSPKTKNELTERLLRAYDADPVGVWSLEYRLFRSTPRRQDDRDLKLKNLLRLDLEHDHSSDKAYIWYCDAFSASASAPATDGAGRRASVIEQEQLQKTKERNNVLTIPSAQLPEYGRWLNNKMSVLWTQRSALYVVGGSSYAIEDEGIIVRIGELRQRGPAGQQQQNVRGVIVSLEETKEGAETQEVAVDDSAEADGANGQGKIGHLAQIWKSFGSEGAKEYKPSPGQTLSENEVVRMYCDLLRMKG